MSENERAFAVSEHLLEHHNVALALELERAYDVECLVEHDLLPLAELGDVDRRADSHPQFAAAGEDVDRVVVVGLEEHAVAGRRLRQPVDFFFQRDDLVAGFAERRSESVVLTRQRGNRRLRFGQTVVDGACVSRRLSQLAAQRRHFFFEEVNLLLQVLGIVGARRSTMRVVTTGHERHLPMWTSGRRHVPPVCRTDGNPIPTPP